MDNPHYPTKVKFKANSVEMEFEGSESFVESCLQRYCPDAKIKALGFQPSGDGLLHSVEEATALLEKISEAGIDGSADLNDHTLVKESVSLEEFAGRYIADTVAEKCLVIAYYLREYENQHSFSVDDIDSLYKSIGWKRPKAIGQALINCSNDQEWFERAEGKGMWKLIRAGEIHIENGELDA